MTGTVLLGGAIIGLGVPPAAAQSPSPYVYFQDVSPSAGTPPADPAPGVQPVIVVEGLGAGQCGGGYTTLNEVETATTYWIDQGYMTVTEVSPQSCGGSISTWETVINDITQYVEASPGSSPGSLWDGVMVDEESGFGYTPSQLETLNGYVSDVMATTPGISWWSTEDFSGQGDWSQSQYDSIIGSSWNATQNVTQYMISLTNTWISNGTGSVLVTWSPTYAYPYNTQAGASAVINGSPFYQNGYYWSNEWTSQ
ncbi:MAG: hypothetical protein ACYCOS_03815 [Sulfobacillus sp.]